MSLPQDLKQYVEHAYTEMVRHEKHALIPIHRSTIYDLLNSNEPLRKRQAFKWLSIITARHVLPVWEKTQPTDSSPQLLVKMAEEVINNEVALITAEKEANKAWERIEEIGVVDSEITMSRRTFYAYVAIYGALIDALGRDPFEDMIMDGHSTDSDLDPWSSDTALWAAAAYSGRVGDQESDAAKRHKFWEWWLQEAIPTAWSIANK
jgi:Immunity protein Imm5